MRFTCASCGKSYEIPDDRVKSAADTLRVRCQGCRAIMAVDRGTAQPAPMRAMHDDTSPDLPTLRARKRSATLSSPAFTDVHAAFERPEELPASLSASGIYHPVAGVERSVTGIHLDAKRKNKKRAWYAAIDGKSRGPYTEDELLTMAKKGRVRGRTLVWKPGFEEWTRIRSRDGETPELAWLRDAVIARKRSEMAATAKAQASMGIHPIVLDNRSFAMPPPLPDDANGELPLYDATLAPDVMGGDGERRPQVLKAIFAGALLGSLLVVVLLYTFPILMGLRTI